LVEFFYGGSGAEEMAVDDDGDLRRGRTGDDGDDPKTKGAAARGSGAKRLKEESTRAALGVYIPLRCRCDRVIKLGGTEMDNC
jgi:hypothetical protein